MKDFRNSFYEKYSSTFKSHLSTFDESVISAQHKMYRLQYLPLLKDYDKSASILELGCGPGIFLEFLLKSGYRNLMGIDVSSEQIEIASAKKLNVQQADVLNYISTTENRYDIIFAIDLIEHFNKEELLILFENVYKKLKSNGSLIFHTPNGLGINAAKFIYGDLTHLTIFTPNSANQILHLSGFEKTSYYETEPYAKDLRGAVRLVLWKLIKSVVNFVRFVETGSWEKILTQNFIGIARKNSF